MKNLLALCVGILLSALLWLVIEGGYSVWNMSSPKPPLAVQLKSGLKWYLFDNLHVKSEPAQAASSAPDTASQDEVKEANKSGLPVGRNFKNEVIGTAVEPERYIQSWEHLEAWIPTLGQAGYLLGGDLNGPTQQMSRDALTQAGGQDIDYKIFSKEEHAKIGLLPNFTFDVAVIRGFYGSDPWAQPVVYGPFPGAKGNPSIKKFLDQYTLMQAHTTIDEDGFRTTLPKVDSQKVILVIGDSIVFGALVDDKHTLPSYLQQLYPGVRIINSGIASSQSDDNYIRLKKLLKQFAGRVEGVVYVHFENDFFSNIRPGVVLDPQSAVAPLKQLLDEYDIKNRLYMVHASVFITCPQASRPEAKVYAEKNARHEAVVRLAKEAGFTVIDSRKIVQDYTQKAISLWACYGLYSDHSHFSAVGNEYFAHTIYNTHWFNPAAQ